MSRIELTELGVVLVFSLFGFMSYILFLIVDFLYALMGEKTPQPKQEEPKVPWFELGENEEEEVQDSIWIKKSLGSCGLFFELESGSSNL